MKHHQIHFVSALCSLCALWLIFFIPGCKVGPNYHPPKGDVPGQWHGTTTAPGTQPSTQPAATTQPVDLAHWWTAFADPTLDSLINRAIASNLDLRQAEARIREARASRGVVASGLWPAVDTSASYSRSSSGGQSNNHFGNFNPGKNLFQAGLDAAWEVDIFGGVRRDIEASEADVNAAIEDRRDVLVTLTSEVALNYAQLRGFQQQLVIARENLDAQRHTVDVTQQRLRAGLIGRLDVVNAEAQAAATESLIPTLETAAQQTIYAISVLLGQPPAALASELSPEGQIPAASPEVPVGLPSDLLMRRPDIRRATEQVHAATARIGVATADLFPRFSLTGSLGLESDQLASLVNWSSRFYAIGPSVSWPLFDAGKIRSNINVQNARQEESLLTYRQSVLVALQDVESALIAVAKEQERHAALERAAAASADAVDLATRLYTHGQTDFLNVLSAQRNLFASEDALVQSKRDAATNLIALYKALGGGWVIESTSAR